MPIDYSKYPKDWKETRKRILERANNRCEQCKVKNKEIILRGEWKNQTCFQDMDGNIYSAIDGTRIGSDYFGEVDPKMKRKLTKVVLTIAHLDHDPENHSVKDSRLKALCQKCHLDYDRQARKNGNLPEIRRNKEAKNPKNSTI